MIIEKIQIALAAHHQNQAELTRLEEAYEFASRIAEDARRQAHQLSGEITALAAHHENLKSRGQMPDRGHLERITAQHDALVDTSKKAFADLARFNRMIGDLQIAMQQPEHAAVTLEDVLAVQGQTEEKRAALAKIDATIAGERAKIAAAVVNTAEVDKLQQRLEDLLADGIDDLSQAADIEDARSRLSAARADLERDRDAIATLTERAEQTIAGLERKRQALLAELDGHTETHRHAAWLFLKTEMGTLRAGYLEAGRALIDTFARMRALDLLSRNVAGIGAVRAFAGDAMTLELPQPFCQNGRREPVLSAAPNTVEMALRCLRAEHEAAGLKLS